MKKVSVFGDFSKEKEKLTIAEVLNRFKIGIYAYIIRPLRQMLKEGNKAGYDSAKKLLDAVTFCGLFNGRRKMEYLVDYTGIIVLDIDKLTAEALRIVRELIVGCEYTLACFVSPSGAGLKVLVQVSTGVKEHVATFNAVLQYYTKVAGVEIDRSGRDVTRLCFVTYDPDLYYNPGAKTFDPGCLDGVLEVQQPRDGRPLGPPLQPGWRGFEIRDSEDVNSKGQGHGLQIRASEEPVPSAPVAESAEATKATSTSAVPKGDSTAKTYLKCVKRAGKYYSFIEGQRNEFVFTLARQLCKAGITEEAASFLIMQDYNFDEQEVCSSIKSAYNFVGPEPTTGDPKVDPHQYAEKGTKKPFDYQKVKAFLRENFQFHYNEVTGLIEYRDRRHIRKLIKLDDYHENTILDLLMDRGQMIPVHILHSLLNSSFSPPYDPFKSYAKKLRKWDGKTDYLGQLIATVQTTDNPYWDFCMRKWYVALVAGLIDDEVCNHTILVFVGAQGKGKTSWGKLLLQKALREYMGTAIIRTDSKDSSIQMSECGLLLLDELEALSRQDLELLKEAVTRSEIRVRRPYGRNSGKLVRRASIFAGVNNNKILTDITGSRRFLCFNVTKINYQHKVDMDGCMAQALALIDGGFTFWFDEDETEVLKEHNSDFTARSIVEELIVTWMKKVSREDWDNRNKMAIGQSFRAMSATQISDFLVVKTKFNMTDYVLIQIGKIMNKIGFEHVKKANICCYLVQVFDAPTVESRLYSSDDPGSTGNDQNPNDLNINPEDNSPNPPDDDLLPF
jgi:hypothetical protein